MVYCGSTFGSERNSIGAPVCSFFLLVFSLPLSHPSRPVTTGARQTANESRSFPLFPLFSLFFFVLRQRHLGNDKQRLAAPVRHQPFVFIFTDIYFSWTSGTTTTRIPTPSRICSFHTTSLDYLVGTQMYLSGLLARRGAHHDLRSMFACCVFFPFHGI